MFFTRRKSSLLFAAAATLWMAACSPMEQEFSAAKTSPKLTDTLLRAGDGELLPIRTWMPPVSVEQQQAESEALFQTFKPSATASMPEAIIIALHGFNDYSNAFTNAGKYLSRRGIGVIAFDQRGFGRTRHHGIWAGIDNLVQDTVYMVNATAEAYPGTPIYLLGESMGGATVITTLAEHDLPQVNGAILSSPAIWGNETMNGFYRGTLWLLAHTMPSKHLTGSNLKILASDNIAMLRALGRDPLIIKKTRIDAIYGIVQLMDEAYTSLDHVKKPLFLLYGAKDQVIPKEPLRKAAPRLAKLDHTAAYYPDGYHMLLRDLKAEIVLNDLVSWVKSRERPLPSGYHKNWEQEFPTHTTLTSTKNAQKN